MGGVLVDENEFVSALSENIGAKNLADSGTEGEVLGGEGIVGVGVVFAFGDELRWG